MNKKVFIGTPMYGGMCTYGYTSSLLENIMLLNQKNIETRWCFLYNESLITRARNAIVHSFLESEMDYLMFIDSDIVFEKDTILKLLESNCELVCATYPKKYIDWEKIKSYSDKVAINEVKNLGSSYAINILHNNNTVNNDIVEISHGPTGFMLIHKNIFKKLIPNTKKIRSANFGKNSGWYYEFFKTDVSEEDSMFLSEDWYFCEQVQKIGEKIFLRTDINLGHIGTYLYSGDFKKFGFNIN